MKCFPLSLINSLSGFLLALMLRVVIVFSFFSRKKLNKDCERWRKPQALLHCSCTVCKYAQCSLIIPSISPFLYSRDGEHCIQSSWHSDMTDIFDVIHFPPNLLIKINLLINWRGAEFKLCSMCSNPYIKYWKGQLWLDLWDMKCWL